jgi:lysylphosphatidylglycerol synthetase-like protein (DUF2156 family)
VHLSLTYVAAVVPLACVAVLALWTLWQWSHSTTANRSKAAAGSPTRTALDSGDDDLSEPLLTGESSVR